MPAQTRRWKRGEGRPKKARNGRGHKGGREERRWKERGEEVVFVVKGEEEPSKEGETDELGNRGGRVEKKEEGTEGKAEGGAGG